MSPVHSISPKESRFRRRSVQRFAAELFPESLETLSPNEMIGGRAPATTDPSDSSSDHPMVGCPSPSSATLGVPRPVVPHETHNRADSRVWNADAFLHQSDASTAQQRAGERLVGIARLAASSPAAPTKRNSTERPEYFLLPVKSILNSCDSKRVPFEWTINPYRGCEFGCKYCYARYTHEYMELDGCEFEKKIYVKKDAAPLLAWDVAHKYSYASEASGGERPEIIAIGTATDPYQPAEREYGVTRACLEELAKREGLSVSVITKSNQIVRDIDLFKRIAERSELSLNITITTLRTRLARLLEPRAPRPDLRLVAVKQLRDAGLAVGVSASPLVPGITDREGDLEAVASAAHDAGAQWFFSGVLFLMPSSAKQFLPFIREKFPRLATQYEQWYAKNGYAPEEYRKKVAERVARIRQKYGFGSREKRKAMPYAQMSLSWDAAMEPMRSCAAG
jgi:DNA repair photolyase